MHKLGGFWIRAAAYIVDAIILAIAVVILSIFFPAVGLAITSFWFEWVIGAFYFIPFWYKTGATPGKMLFGLRIVDAGSFQTPSAMQYIIRYVGYIPSTFILLIGFIMVAFHPRKQGLHDLIAKTVVIKDS